MNDEDRLAGLKRKPRSRVTSRNAFTLNTCIYLDDVILYTRFQEDRSTPRTTKLGISLTFPPHFFWYSPTGSTLLMHGVGNSPLPVRATSQNIPWSTTKVNEESMMCSAPTRRMTKVRPQSTAHTEL